MLETKFKIAFLLVVLFMAGLPILGILKGTTPPPMEPSLNDPSDESLPVASTRETPVKEEMVLVPAGPFVRGTTVGGYDERPQQDIYVDAFSIDRFEVTTQQYQAFVASTGHRKAAPPSRYAKNLSGRS
ncbi:MAG: SUMF1/EgtB/PvdO family nonheme iron enzyme, partial [Nitrospiraceae bacterium]